ncbi:DoxX family protein [Streptomyces sp. NPDC089919]|uniref:DoxX family protein n=1 Tax=Streptomyces sp. NPDC089919 TaxID=3155188 RepID=UPI00341A025E
MSSPSATLRTSTETGLRPATAAGTTPVDAGLLLIRLALGLTMAAHGAQKLFGWFGGGGISGTGQFFEMSGYPAGEAMAVVAGLSEVLGGLGLAVGLLTPLAGAALVGTLVNALAVVWNGSFFEPAGVEFELLLTVAAAGLTLTGPGRYALDSFVPVLRTHRLRTGAGALLLGLLAAGVVLLVRS